MSWYFFRVLDMNGKVHSGVRHVTPVPGTSVRALLEARFNGTVLVLRALPTWLMKVAAPVLRLGRPKVHPQALAAMLRDLAVMCQAGVPVMDAVRTIAEDEWTGGKGCAEVARRVLEDLKGGSPLSESFARQPDIFPETVRNLIAIGDESGTMDHMLMESAQHVERLNALKADTRQALIYPAFVFAAILGAAAFWLYYVIPNLASLFKQLNAKLPALTVAVIDFADWLGTHLLTLFVGLMAVILGLVTLWRSSMKFKRWVYRALHVLPVSRTLVTASGLAFLAEYLALMVSAGVDIVRSLTVLEHAMANLYYRDRMSLAKLYVERGDRLSSSMKRVGGFPPLMLRMISVGEESGSLDRQLTHLASEYRSRLSRVVATLSEIIKPVIVLIAGALLLLFVVALVLPVYDLIGQAMAVRH
jgi:general secretion pathway protein F/type IV pilus assembly protein PilC